MSSQPSAEVRAAMKRRAAEPKVVDAGLLKQIQAKASEARDLAMEIEDLETKLSEKKEALNKIYQSDLPLLMDEAGVDRIGLPASGNMPAMDAVLGPYYSANIAAKWPEERRRAAFDWLEKNGHGDLIKTELELSLPRGDKGKALKIVKAVSKSFGVTPSMTEAVHSGTLAAWLKELIERRGERPTQATLDLLGASVGRVVKMKPRKD